MSDFSVQAIGHKKNDKLQKPKLPFGEFNSFYQRLKSGEPIIGNLLNKPVKTDNGTCAFNS